MYLHTTTWKQRNSDMLARVFEEAAASVGPRPTIMDVGPGAGSAPWMRLHPGGKSRHWNKGQRLWGGDASMGRCRRRARRP